MKNIIIILFLTSPFILFSQEDLSLENAIKIGLKQNFDIQLSSKNLNISKIKNNLANAGALPTIDISAKNERSVLDQSNNPTSFIQEILKAESITVFSGYKPYTLTEDEEKRSLRLSYKLDILEGKFNAWVYDIDWEGRVGYCENINPKYGLVFNATEDEILQTFMKPDISWK